MRQLPHSKRNQNTASSDEAARRRYTRTMNRLAEDLVNQLCALNLIAAKLRNRMCDRSGALNESDWQTFDACIRQTSLLGEGMAQLLKNPVDIAADDLSPPLNLEGRVIRLLRMVPKLNR